MMSTGGAKIALVRYRLGGMEMEAFTSQQDLVESVVRSFIHGAFMDYEDPLARGEWLAKLLAERMEYETSGRCGGDLMNEKESAPPAGQERIQRNETTEAGRKAWAAVDAAADRAPAGQEVRGHAVRHPDGRLAWEALPERRPIDLTPILASLGKALPYLPDHIDGEFCGALDDLRRAALAASPTGQGVGAERERLCEKCGSTDIHTGYRAIGDRLDQGFGTDRTYFDRVTEECLRRTCRGCGYKWTAPVRSTPPAPTEEPTDD